MTLAGATIPFGRELPGCALSGAVVGVEVGGNALAAGD